MEDVYFWSAAWVVIFTFIGIFFFLVKSISALDKMVFEQDRERIERWKKLVLDQEVEINVVEKKS